jgi:exosome complex component RRP40
LGVIVQKTFEFFNVDINSEFGQANLKTLEFQGATKTNKPRFEEGSLIFCRVL